MSEYTPGQAFDFLVAEQWSDACSREEQKELGSYATEILRRSGHLIFAKGGNWPVVHSQGVTTGYNTLLTQATEPVQVNSGSYVALRDQEEHPRSAVEIVWLDDKAPGAVQLEENVVLASFANNGLRIPGRLKPTTEHRDALRCLLSFFDQELEVSEEVATRNLYLPKVVLGDLLGRGLSRVTDIREGSELINEALAETAALRA